VSIEATYMGSRLHIEAADADNLAYFAHCARHDFHLQSCTACRKLRYPPTSACPWCATLASEWQAVPGTGRVHSLTVVQSALSPAFREFVPYAVLLVDLDTQLGHLESDDALRVIGNLCTPDGRLAPAGDVGAVRIGRRVRMVFTDVAPGLALPQWTLDDT